MSNSEEEFVYSDGSDYDDAIDNDDFEEEYADDDLGFDSVVAEKKKKKQYEVDFSVITEDQLVTTKAQEIAHVAGILSLKPEHSLMLLQKFRWNKERLIEKYMENCDDVLADAGVDISQTAFPTIICTHPFLCEICCNDEPNLPSISLTCGHRYCRFCYGYYLKQKIIEEGEGRFLKCPGVGCKLCLDKRTVRLLVDDEAFKRYQKLILHNFVDDNEYLRWCPAPNCQYVIECHIPSSSFHQIVPSVQCHCEYRFCFGCGLADHLPCPCFIVKKWLQKCEDDSETANWISANTKECSKCQATIEKNGGCNHMTCKKCKYEFCWVCLGPWSEHGTQWYNCNRYEEKSGTEARDLQTKSRAQLERYLHYYNRYANHEQSAKLDKELYLRTEKKMEDMQQRSDLSWIEVQFLRKAVDTVVQCRMTLKWTYAFAFYLAKSNHTEIFEDNQRDLEMAVEHLSELLEKPFDETSITDLKQSVLDRSVYVNSRREVLLTDTAQGLLEGRWKFADT